MSAPAHPPEVFAPVLARLGNDAAAYFNAGRLRLSVRRYEDRPFSHLMQVDVWRDTATACASSLFVKIVKSRAIAGGVDAARARVVHDYEMTRRAYSWMSSHPDLAVVPPVACYPEHLAIVTEEVRGMPLLDYLQRRASWFRSGDPEELHAVMATVGRWVRIFQGVDARGTIALDAIRRYIDHRLQRLVREGRHGFGPEDRMRVLDHIEALGSQIPTSDLIEVAVHSDLSLGNLLVSGRRVVGLDFAMSKRGSSLHDLARLFVQLDLLAVKPYMRRPVLRRLQHIMIAGFDPSLVPESPLFRLLLLLHRINHLTGLSVTRASFATERYNGVVRYQHRRWLADELQRGVSVSGAR